MEYEEIDLTNVVIHQDEPNTSKTHCKYLILLFILVGIVVGCVIGGAIILLIKN